MAGVLSCPGAVASHGSAGFLWGIVARPPAVDLIVGRDHGRRPGIRAHRSRIAPDQITKIEGIPVSTISRTLLDLASALNGRELEQAVAGAERAHVSRRELLELMARSRNRVGMPRLRALLEHTGQLPLTRSEAEDRFLALIRKGELAPPEVNATLAGYEVDFAWRDERIVVEVDGFAFHSSRSRFESDRRRDAKLAAEGFLVMRVTWRQLAHEPEATLVRLAQALTVARAGGSRGT